MQEQQKIRNFDLEYEKISDEEIVMLYKYFSTKFNDFLREMDFPSDVDYSIDAYSLVDAIVRVDKRKAYFLCFHNMTINEKKEAALYAYWFIKFKPFSIVDARYSDNKRSARINELFAAYIIYSILLFDDDAFTTMSITQPKKDKYTYHDKLMYSLHYRCFSIDSIMFIVDTLTPETFKIEYDVEP